MRIVATDTVELPPWPPPLVRPGHWMTTHRVAAGDASQSGMTTDAELVDRLLKHICIVAGMRIVTGHAAAPLNDAVYDWHGIFAINQVLFVAVTGYTQLN